MEKRKDLLIQLLFDYEASITERDEAAMELAEFSDNQTSDALLLKGQDSKEDELVLNSVGEALGAIWIKQNKFDQKAYQTLIGTTRYGIYVVIKSRRPEWIELYQLEKDNFLD